MKEKPVDGQAAVTLKEFSPHVGDSVRRMLQDRNGRYYPEPLVCQVRSVDNHGCVIALVAGQGHASHKYLMEWFTRVQPWA